MRLLKHRSIAFSLSFVLLLAIATGGSVIAFASSGPNTTARATIKGGSLTESTSPNGVNLDVDKKATLATYSLPITVIDARGTGNGWKLMITSTRFLTIDKDKKPDVDQLPGNASRITKVSVSCAAGSTCTKPTSSVSYPLVIPAATTPPKSVKFFNAAPGSGMGGFLLTMVVNVSIPASTEAGIYSSIITLTIANGP
jgi:hypothetical protein